MALTKRRPPLADLVRSELKQLIVSGKAPVGSRLPSEADLCDQYNVSRITLREAVQGLVQEGYVVRRQGSGTYVTRRPALHNSLDTNFSYTEYLAHAGIRAGKKVLSARMVEASADTAEALGLDEGDRVAEVRRLRTADGSPAVDRSTRSRPTSRRCPWTVRRSAARSTSSWPIRSITSITARRSSRPRWQTTSSRRCFTSPQEPFCST